MSLEMSLETRNYIKEFYNLEFNNNEEPSEKELEVNQLGYFIFDVRKLDLYTSTIHIASTLYNANKIYLNGYYSYIYAALETLIENNLHLQVNMLVIDIKIWDSMYICWKLLSKFTNIKLLYIDASQCINKRGQNITEYLPKSLEALYINMPYYNLPFSESMSASNLKVLKLYALKFNQELKFIPPMLETLIIKSGEFNQHVNNLSSNLKHLILLCPKFAKSLDNLPHGLEYFAGLYFNCFTNIENFYNLEIENLPSSIKIVLLDNNLFVKHRKKLEYLYPHCHFECYDIYNNLQFISKHLLDLIYT